MNNFRSLVLLIGFALFLSSCSKQEEFDINYCEFDGKEFALGSAHPEEDCVSCMAVGGSSFLGLLVIPGSVDWRNGCCTIDGNTYLAWDKNPDNECQHCNPRFSTSRWSNILDGVPCSTGECDGHGNCGPPTGHCLIDKLLIADGESNPLDSCQVCISKYDRYDWSNDCCTISGEKVRTGTRDPSRECWWCDAKVSTYSWSAVTQGQLCSEGRCDGTGYCIP